MFVFLLGTLYLRSGNLFNQLPLLLVICVLIYINTIRYIDTSPKSLYESRWKDGKYSED